MENSVDNVDSQAISGEAENEEDKDSTDSEEVEPCLKYVRITNDLKDILKNDAASCVAVHTKFICIGTVWGAIYLLDMQGNSIIKDETEGKERVSKALLAHTVAVNQISIDSRGDYIASCSDDGKVFIYGLYSTENHRDMIVGRLVRAIAIDPFYYKPGSGRRFITGDEKLSLYEKTLFTRTKSTVLADASHEGGVKSIKWNPVGVLVAWATLLGFRVYDIEARKSLGLIKWQRNTEVDMKCHMCWKDKGTLLVGWADTVRVCTILERPQSQFNNSEVSPYILQPVFTFETEFIVCGVGPLEGSQVVVLGFTTSGGKSGSKEADVSCIGSPQRPHLHVIEPASHDYLDVSTDNLSLRGYQNYTASDYSLECLVEESRYVIVSPKDLVVACPYDGDDHVDWLLDHCKFEEALCAMEDGTKKYRHTFLSVGRAYIDDLLRLKDYKKAGEICKRVLGSDKRLWEAEINKFAQAQQLRSLISYLPTGNNNKLATHIYDLVLYEYLKFEPEGFLKLVREWPASLYNVSIIVNAVVHQLITAEPKIKLILIESLAILYSHEGKHEIALATYMKIQNKGIFELIKKQNLYSSIPAILDDLMKLDSKQTIATLIETKDIDPDVIVKKFSNNQLYLYQYLDAYKRKGNKKCAEYDHLLVRLYAEYNREKLKPLLQTSSHYSIMEALKICKKKEYHQETAFLLESMGNTKEALAILTNQLDNIEEAVEFCIKHDDMDLWQDIINYSCDKPSCVKYLLNRVGNYINPIVLVKRISSETKIPGLKSDLVKMMQDYTLQVSFMECCKQILTSDYFDLHERLVSTRQKGSALTDDHICGACMKKLFAKGNKDIDDLTDNIIAFHCNHYFHVNCLPTDNDSCVLCTSQKPNKKQLNLR